MVKNTLFNNVIKRLATLNRYYKITRFYSFLKDTSFKGGIVLALFVLLILGIDTYIVDINSLLNNVVETYSPKIVMLFFLFSESFLGLVPPEILIVWASKSSHPALYLFILATISYIGGIISYLIGGRLFLIPSIKNHIEIKIAHHIINLRKWGGLFVVLGAISPIPHSIVSLSSGLIKYSFKNYLLWSLFRYLRFAVYAIIIFKVLD
jgi:membrane protein YqaA with SNARE-associated domain